MAHAELRGQVEAACREAVAASPTGIAAVAPAAIVARFEGMGAATSTLFKWVASYLASGAALPKSEPAPPETVSAVVASSPSAVASAPAPSGIAVLDMLHESLRAAQQVMSYAKRDDGSIRNAKLLIAASEHLRRNLETAVKLRESMMQQRDLDLFLDEVIREIEKESPAVAKRLFQRLNDILLVRGA